MSYADEWNKYYTGPRSAGPTLIVVDGFYEEDAEVIESMDVDDGSPIDASFAVDRVQSERENWSSHGLDRKWQLVMDTDMDLDVSETSANAKHRLIAPLPLLSH